MYEKYRKIHKILKGRGRLLYTKNNENSIKTFREGGLLYTKNIVTPMKITKRGVGFGMREILKLNRILREGSAFVYENYWKFNKILRGGLGFWVRRDIINSIRSLREGVSFCVRKILKTL